MIPKKSIFNSGLTLYSIKPNLGFLGASFATLLTILTINDRSPYLIEAADDFSIEIPLIVATIALSSFNFEKYLLLLLINSYLNNIIQLVGYFFCCHGIYKCFCEISPHAAQNFKYIGAVVLFIIAIQTIIHDYIKTQKVRKGRRQQAS
jgi:hypothetical protein